MYHREYKGASKTMFHRKSVNTSTLPFSLHVPLKFSLPYILEPEGALDIIQSKVGLR